MMEETLIDEVTAVVAGNWGGIGRKTLGILKEQFPGTIFIAVPASDVLEEPARKSGSVDLHFIDTQNHCMSVISDSKRAGGILLAIRE
jgi:hypothetical protein